MDKAGIIGPQRDVIAPWLVRHRDDWSGVSDSRERRRIQNRLNQRMRRSRKRQEQFIPNPASVIQHVAMSNLREAATQDKDIDSMLKSIADAIRNVNILEPQSAHNHMILRRFEWFAYRCYVASTPQITLLPSLSQYNFIRALFTNIDILGLSSDQMQDDSLSPFNLLDLSDDGSSMSPVCRLPASLRPTNLQRATLHHPWIDLIPHPEMRDNLFRRGLGFFDEDELCRTLSGRVPSRDPGMLVWGDPWDPNNWEVTEAFIGSWGWCLAGCLNLLHSTNKWRARRGEKPLFRLAPGMFRTVVTMESSTAPALSHR